MLLLIGVTTGFLFDVSNCTTGNVCGCNENQLFCNSRGLIDIPLLNITGTNISFRELFFSSNDIETLRNGAFSSLRNLTATSIDVYLNNNNISSMGDMCFEELYCIFGTRIQQFRNYSYGTFYFDMFK